METLKEKEFAKNNRISGAKILIIANNSTGLFNFRKDLIEEFLKDNEVVAAIPFNGKIDDLKELGCRLIKTQLERRGKNPLLEFRLLSLYKKILEEENPDLVITYTIKPNIYGGIACRWTNKMYACNITGLGAVFQKKSYLRTIITKMYRYALKKASVVFFENTSNRELFVNNGIVSKDKTHVLHGAGVNLERFSYLPYPRNDSFHFIFIGRVMREKGVYELLEATKRLIEEDEKCVLDMVGGLDDSTLNNLDEYELQGWLHCYGYQSDVRSFIRSSDCLVLPSYHEGMANTNLECASSGRPIITSDIPGCREAVIEGVTGLLCKPKDIDSLYRSMKEMLHKQIEEREIMGKNGRKHMENVFDKKAVVKDTIRVLSQYCKFPG